MAEQVQALANFAHTGLEPETEANKTEKKIP